MIKLKSFFMKSFILLFVMTLVISNILAKEIYKEGKVKKSENKFILRVDGLACYFCAYGLERAFKKSGKISDYIIDLKKGIVETTLIKSKPLLELDTVRKYVYDAGFTLRRVKVSLIGKVLMDKEQVLFYVNDTHEKLFIKKNKVLTKLLKDKKITDRNIGIIAVASKHSDFLMALEIESYDLLSEEE